VYAHGNNLVDPQRQIKYARNEKAVQKGNACSSFGSDVLFCSDLLFVRQFSPGQNSCGLSIVPFDPGRKLGINMTACYTGASLAKKTIFAKHYKPLKYPVYTIAPSIDKFIRDFYRGGRVEIFHMGRVPRDTL